MRLACCKKDPVEPWALWLPTHPVSWRCTSWFLKGRWGALSSEGGMDLSGYLILSLQWCSSVRGLCVCVCAFWFLATMALWGGVYLCAHTAISGWCSNQEGKKPNRLHIFYPSASLSYRHEVTRRRQLVVLIRSEACDCSDSFLAALPPSHPGVCSSSGCLCVCLLKNQINHSATTLDLFTLLGLWGFYALWFNLLFWTDDFWYSLWGSLCHIEDKNSFNDLISFLCLRGCWILVVTLLVAGTSSAQAGPSLLWPWINLPPR